ncbi:MAG: hypothetical protein HUJ73_01785, partial [Eubacterium sp.]|nr:hypothetical protein [Eubacterium sp.]
LSTDLTSEEASGEEGTGETADGMAADETGAEEITEGENAADQQMSSSSATSAALTVTDFRNILQDLYTRGYVLVDVNSLAEKSPEGFKAADIKVPAGKKPLILSQQDASYSQNNDGFPVGLTKSNSGEVQAAYFNNSGKLVSGSVDVVPIVEEFIDDHPDFSCENARGIIGVTGYRGILGYQIEENKEIVKTVPIVDAYDETLNADETVNEAGTLTADETLNEAETVAAAADETLYTDETVNADGTVNTDETLSADGTSSTGGSGNTAGSGTSSAGNSKESAVLRSNKEAARKLISSLKSSGWQIASSGFSGVSYGSSDDIVREDSAKWKELVEPITGSTDLLLVPGGADIGNWSGYTTDNTKYTILNQAGFKEFFFDNDGALSWAQITPSYVRESVHTINTYSDYTVLQQLMN